LSATSGEAVGQPADPAARTGVPPIAFAHFERRGYADCGTIAFACLRYSATTILEYRNGATGDGRMSLKYQQACVRAECQH
jgi:hypothetical protein